MPIEINRSNNNTKMKQVPWLDWTEWLDTYSVLKSDPLKSLPILERWRIRQSLPVRIESTRAILTVISEISGIFSPDSLLQVQ